MTVRTWFEEIITALPVMDATDDHDVEERLEAVFPLDDALFAGQGATAWLAPGLDAAGPCIGQTLRSSNRSLGPEPDATD